MPTYGKMLKIFQNQESFKAESWYIVSGTQDLHVFIFSNDEHRLTFDLFFMARSSCIPKDLYGENVEKSFSENVLSLIQLYLDIYTLPLQTV